MPAPLGIFEGDPGETHLPTGDAIPSETGPRPISPKKRWNETATSNKLAVTEATIVPAEPPALEFCPGEAESGPRDF